MLRHLFPDAKWFDLLESDTLIALDEEIGFERKIVVAMERQARPLENTVEVFPAEQFLKTLCEGKIIR